MIIIALFCNFIIICVLKPHSKMLVLKCGAISELYVILGCFSLFITPNVRDNLFAILWIYRSEFSVSRIVIPSKTNCRTHSICWQHSLIPQSHGTPWTPWRLRDCQKRGRGGVTYVTAFTDQYYSRRRAVVLPSRNFPSHRGVTEASPKN